MSIFTIKQYSDSYEKKWDNFVLSNSINGTFLQTRNFLNYHNSNKFKDCSLIILKGNTLVAVVPACEILENNMKVFYSHKGSTFGGIIIGSSFNTIINIKQCIELIDKYIKDNNYKKAYFRLTSDIFQRYNSNLIEYFLFKEKYSSYDELSLIIDNSKYKNDIELNFTSSKRRDLKYSLHENLKFKKLDKIKEINDFYELLKLSLKKYNVIPVHSLEELVDFKENRLSDIVEFYGVYKDEILISGAMIFKFYNNVYHTQYLTAHPKYLNLYPMNFMNYNLIKDAYDRGFKFFSFGISTENRGEEINLTLATFKEGFGAEASINKTFYKELN